MLIRKAFAEMIGTFAIIFAGCGSIMVAERFPGAVPSSVIPIIFGLTVSAMIYAVGHISGAHFNPAVTLAFAAARHFPGKEVFSYCFAQFVGGLAAIALLNFILPSGQEFGATVPSVSFPQALAWEFVLTFFLTFVITAVATDTRATGTMAGAAIGATVMLCAFVGGPVTGASMNPARSLAPALFQGELSRLWIYIAGPTAGAIAGALTYQAIRCEPKNKNAKGCC